MVVYGIAVEQSITYGHGDCGTELHICGTGGYGRGPYPPIFTNLEDAKAWMAEHPTHCGRIVTLELRK